MGRIKALRWTVGGGLPPDLSAALSPSERDFFSAYNRRAPPDESCVVPTWRVADAGCLLFCA